MTKRQRKSSRAAMANKAAYKRALLNNSAIIRNEASYRRLVRNSGTDASKDIAKGVPMRSEAKMIKRQSLMKRMFRRSQGRGSA